MKRGSVLFFFVTVVLLTLQNCKPDKPLNIHPNDPDSLYTGTSYIFQKPFRFPNIINPYKDSVTYEGIELGKRLFYDKHLSSTGQLACASCHKQQYAFSDSGNAVSTNVFGPTKRNAPAIQNLLWAGKIFWDGRANTLGAQAKDAFHGEQNLDISSAVIYLKSDSTYTRLFKKAFGRPGDVTEEKVYLAVQQFMMTLISSNSRFDRVQRGEDVFTTSETNGFAIFSSNNGECFHCHTDGYSFLMTDNNFRNNGIDSAATINDFVDIGRGKVTNDPNDYGKFRDPSLRNIALTPPYMHDGRFKTLTEVIDFYSDSIKRYSPTVDANLGFNIHSNGRLQLSASDKQDLLNFLYTLTDTSFISDPKFKSPF
jgi:cytochrome c peroxidase